MKKIKLGNGGYTTIDDDDYDEMSKYHWFKMQTGYVARKEFGRGGKMIYMHRQIMNAPKGMVVDHIDHDKLDNRKSNLRLCLQSENSRNCRKTRGREIQYKGVGLNGKKGKKYRAYIMKDRKYIHLGHYETALDAARAYNEAALKYHGEFALLNKLED